MSAVLQGAFAEKLRPLHHTTFTAYLLADPASKLNPGKVYPKGEFATLDEAARGAASGKCSVMVVERDHFTGAVVQHFFAVKPSSKSGFYRPALNGGPDVWERGLEIVPFATVAASDWLLDNQEGR